MDINTIITVMGVGGRYEKAEERDGPYLFFLNCGGNEQWLTKRK